MVPQELVHQQPLVRVLHSRYRVHPLPARRNAVAGDEVTAEEEEERGEGDDRSVAQNEVGHDRTDEDHEGVGREQRQVEHEQEVVERAVQLQRPPDDERVGPGLEQ